MASGFRLTLETGKGGVVSYMRGACSIWRDDDRVHVWAEEGYDGWDATSWAEGRKHAPTPDSAQHAGASGVGIRQEIAETTSLRLDIRFQDSSSSATACSAKRHAGLRPE